MNVVKQILKIVLGLAIGGAIGLLIAGAGLVLFTDTTASEYIDRLITSDLSDAIPASIAAVISLAISLPVLVIIHEGGHLVCGLLSGYRFVSFRIFDLTFIRLDGKIRIKRFGIAGTGGQCILLPPDLPLEKIPMGWFNMGGVIANVIALLLILPVFWITSNPFVKEFAVIFCLTDVFIILTNGIPMSLNGFGNDAHNALLLRKSIESKRGIVSQLRCNALIQEGVRPKDMPEEWFTVPENVDYRNSLETSLPLMEASRLIDMGKMEEAYHKFDLLYSHKDELLGIFVKETACELLFTALVTGRIDRAKELYDKELKTYINAYRKVMSSKERILCAIELYMNNDRKAAVAIYDKLEADRDRYLLQGEVKSDLAIMKDMLGS